MIKKRSFFEWWRIRGKQLFPICHLIWARRETRFEAGFWSVKRILWPLNVEFWQSQEIFSMLAEIFIRLPVFTTFRWALLKIKRVALARPIVIPVGWLFNFISTKLLEDFGSSFFGVEQHWQCANFSVLSSVYLLHTMYLLFQHVSSCALYRWNSCCSAPKTSKHVTTNTPWPQPSCW